MRATDYNILLIEDSPDDADLLIEQLGMPSRERHIIDHALNLEQGLQKLRSNDYDVILLDFNLPDTFGTSGLDTIIDEFPHIPVLILTGAIDLELARLLVSHGAQEYLIKGQFNRAQLFALLQSAVQRNNVGNNLKVEIKRSSAIAAECNRQLNESEEKFLAFCNATQDAVIIVNVSNIIINWNTGAERIFGYTTAQAVGTMLHNYLSLETFEADPGRTDTACFEKRCNIQELLHYRPQRLKGCHYLGHKVTLKPAISQIVLDGEMYCILVMQDISKDLAREAELNKSKEAFNSIVEQSKDGIMVVDRNGKVDFANSAALRLFGKASEELIGRECGFPITTYRETELELKVFGRQRAISVSSAETTWDGRPAYILALRDVTELRNLITEKEKLIEHLRSASQEIRMLRGIIPICSYCQKVRNDSGIWTRIEKYVRDHQPGVDFSHGICEDCFRKNFPDMLDAEEKEQ